MRTYRPLLVALFAVFFSPFVMADFSAGMSQDEVAAEVAGILADQACQPWQHSKQCRAVVDATAEKALDAGIESGIVIEALKAAGVPIGPATAATARLARRTLDIITPAKTYEGPGGGVSSN